MSVEAEPKRIALSEPVLKGNEWNYLRECLDTGWISSAGPFVNRFEEEIGRRLEAPHAVATASGTAALHLALIVSGVAAGDEVLMPAITFIAPANAVRYVGATPMFLDIDRDTLQLDVEAVRDFLENETEPGEGGIVNRRTRRRVSAVLPVHLLGHPVDMDPLVKLAGDFGLRVIEDASEAMGAKYKGRSVGALGDIGCMSFNGNKTITCGGGGMLLTHDAAAAARARHLSTQARVSNDEFIHDEVGYNYRLTNLQAAVGMAQAEQLDGFIEKKTTIHESYRAALADICRLEVLEPASWAQSSHWLTTIRVSGEDGAPGARDIRDHLAKSRIEARPLWQPLHLSPAMAPVEPRSLPVTESAYRECLCLPSSPSLSDGDFERVIKGVRTVLGC